jgi:hypothetical protein
VDGKRFEFESENADIMYFFCRKAARARRFFWTDVESGAVYKQTTRKN